MNNKKFSTRDIVLIGILSALVFAMTYIRIDIPTPLGKTMIHFGNVMCILGGLLFGPMVGGLSAGIGSGIFDLFDPVFAPLFWLTFIKKFIFGFVAGKIAFRKGLKGKDFNTNVVAAIVSSVAYVILYGLENFVTNYLIIGKQLAVVLTVTATKMGVSFVNCTIATIVALILSKSLSPVVSRFNR